MNKAIIIDGIKPLNIKERALFSFTVFGTIWLFIEPMSFFKISDRIEALNIYGYLLLITISFIFSFVFDYFNIKRRRSRIEYFNLKIISKKQGAKYLVKAPYNMLIGTFLEKFLEYIIRTENNKEIELLTEKYNASLKNVIVRFKKNKTSTAIIIPDANRTFKQDGFKNNDVFEIEFTIKPEKVTEVFYMVPKDIKIIKKEKIYKKDDN